MKNQLGVTLLELSLVLLIGASMTLLGLRLYQTYKINVYLQQVSYNVDALFIGLQNYYKMNCRGGTLDPNNATATSIGLTNTTLHNYMDSSVQWPLKVIPLVDNTDSNAYIVQFNLITSTRNIYTCTDPSLGAVTCNAVPSSGNSAQPIQASNTVYIWQAQVAVKLAPEYAANATLYQKMLGAECVSAIASGSTSPFIVTPCSATAGGDYLVWERLPSYSVISSRSVMWPTMPTLRQFNNLYTNDDFYAYTVNDSGYNSTTGYQNYLCGG